MANPPFMTPKGGIKPHSLFSIQSKRSEVLFLDYILEHLSPAGRAAVIVPEGIHFVAQSGYIKMRKTMLENDLLFVDITLPHGVFKPYASVKTHILIIDRKLAPKSDSVMFIEVENDGFTQSDTREAIPGSQLGAALQCTKVFKEAVLAGHAWVNTQKDVRTYCVTKKELLKTKQVHIIGRWHDLPNRVIHRQDVPLRRLGKLCDIKDGLSPNMATNPGEYVMVVPAENKKNSDHWDFEGDAVCIPLVSSAGHGKADIKRLHYQEGKFALANTMCALFIKNPAEIKPFYLYIFLSAMCQELLVPLMCGATNVTMDSDQLKDVIIPVPKIGLQEEVIESYIVTAKANEMMASAMALRDLSKDPLVASLAEKVIAETRQLIKSAASKTQISAFIPLS